MSAYESNEEIQIFREYLRIPSVHPNIDYEPCVEFLRRQASDLDLEFRVEYPKTEKKPVVILTWIGTQPELPSIILNSHMDVVPVFEEFWTHKPFDADIDENGKIFARGSQDMKCVGTQYLGALRYFKRNNIQFKRTIHATFLPEEEVGGVEGMRDFIHTDSFKKLNAGFSLDEGIASPTDTFNVFYAERSIWHIQFEIPGNPGHGSLLLKNTAGEKLEKLLNRFIEFRDSQVKRLAENPDLLIGDVTTVNVTQIHGGVQSNVIPPEFKMVIDARLALDVNHAEFENMIKKWCEEAGEGIKFDYEQKQPKVEATKTDKSNPYFTAFKSAIDELGLDIKLQVFPGGTDSRYLRGVGIPAIGFSPMNNTPVLLHDNDEFLRADVYLKGIEIYKKIISNIANLD
ncbi:hypothetical protein PVAND_012612 [Polypedilum vanderplanki]|uniref:N-acyl-aliphatic-L-amino acid amidohydrolase n=1 Tax=Polypedilum vanderplanki TaxID=319348 RepID=A0A9J6CNY6_POLVA|nr:hypothetical protein PVAND_012612 [Polypedilum vanderplanki]